MRSRRAPSAHAKLAAPVVVEAKPDQQICHLMRHGQTVRAALTQCATRAAEARLTCSQVCALTQVMNVFLSQTPYGSPDFQDPLMCASCHINNL